MTQRDSDVVYEFGRFRLDPTERLLLRDSSAVSLTPKAFDLLVYLVEHHGRLVDKQTLLSALWPDVIVEEANLAFNVSALRKLLDDPMVADSMIQTVPTKGYRFVAPVTTQRRSTTESRESSRPHAWWWWMAGGVLLIAGVGWALWRPASPSPPGHGGGDTDSPNAARLLPITTMEGDEMRPALSPEGNQIVFFWGGEESSPGGLYVMMIGSPEMRRLTISPNHDNFAKWSPDGRRIAFVRYSFGEYDGGRLHTVSPLGGPAPRMSDFPVGGPIAWSPDGRHIAASRWTPEDSNEATGIFLIPVDGGNPRAITDTRAPFRDTGMAFSPDGQQLAYASCRPTCDVYLSRLDESLGLVGPLRTLTKQALSSIQGVAWTRDGTSVIFDSAEGRGLLQLSRVPIDGSRPPERIELAGVNAFAPSTTPGADRLAFSRHSWDSDIYRWWPTGAAGRLVDSSFPDDDPAFSPAGDRIAFATERSGKASEIWVAAADGTAAQRLVEGPGRWQTSPQWSPDGERIVFDSLDATGHFHVWMIDVRGGRPTQLTARPGDQRFPTWSRDGQWIYYSDAEGSKSDIWRVPATGGTPERLTRTGDALKAYELPDGKRFVYQSKYSGESASQVFGGVSGGALRSMPLDGERPSTLVNCALAGSLSVGPEGIYYAECRFGDAALHVLNTESGETRFLGTLDHFLEGHGVAVSPDGKFLLYVRFRDGAGGVDVFLIENFH